MKVSGYVRVSTRSQADDGLGLDIQERAIRKWAKDAGHRLVAIYTDAGISGTKELDNRPGLADALVSLKHGDAVGLVVYRLDRLARDLVIQETILAEVKRAGGTMFSVAGGESHFLTDDAADPSRRLIRQVLGAVADYERSMVCLRLQNGRRRKAELGGYAAGPPPLGYKAVNGALVACDDEQAVITRIKELRASGASLRAIAATLEAEGHRTKQGKTSWQPKSLSLIVKRLGADQRHQKA